MIASMRRASATRSSSSSPSRSRARAAARSAAASCSTCCGTTSSLIGRRAGDRHRGRASRSASGSGTPAAGPSCRRRRQRRPRRPVDRAHRVFFAFLGTGFIEHRARARAAGDPADPRQRLRRRPPGRARRGRRRARHGHDRPARSCAASSCRSRCRSSSAASGLPRSTSSPPRRSRRWPASARSAIPIIAYGVYGDAGPPRRLDRRRRARRGDGSWASARSNAAPIPCPLGGGPHPYEAPKAVRPADAVRLRHLAVARPLGLRRRRRREQRRRRTPPRQTTEAAATGSSATTRNAQTSITVGSKNFTEQKVLGEVYAQAPRGRRLQGRQVARPRRREDGAEGAQAGRDRRLPRVHGDGAAVALRRRRPTTSRRTRQQAFDETKQCFAKDKLTALPADAVHVVERGRASRRRRAERSACRRSATCEGPDQDLTLYGSPECRQRTDCLLGLQQTYGLKFKKFTPVDIALRHEVLKRGDDVVSIVFTTDPQNKRENLVLLEDDKGMFPPYNSTFVVRDEVAQQAGADLPKVIEQVQQGLTDEVMQELNARVDLDKETPEQVARGLPVGVRPRGGELTIVSGPLQVRLLHGSAASPERTRPGDAAYDLRCVEAFSLAPGERRMVPTGIAVALPPGVCRARAAAVRARGALRHRRRQRAGPHRPQLPRRGEGGADQPRHHGFRCIGRGSHRAAAARALRVAPRRGGRRSPTFR